MPNVLRIVILIGCLITAVFVFRKIRKSHFVIEDTLFWIFFCLMLLILSAFPKVSYFFAELMGFKAPVNFIFVAFIFLLVVKVFLLSVKLSKTETKLNNLIQKFAIDKFEQDNKEK